MRDHLVARGGLGVMLLPAEDQDEPRLHALYLDRRMPELASLAWGPDERQAFIDMQFRAQQTGYAATFPDAEHWMVMVAEDPDAVGRILVDRRPDEHLVVDLMIVTPWRGRGIGTALMEDAAADAAAEGLPLRLSAAAHDERLVRWYLRLGFVVMGRAGVNVAMERSFAPVEGG